MKGYMQIALLLAAGLLNSCEGMLNKRADSEQHLEASDSLAGKASLVTDTAFVDRTKVHQPLPPSETIDTKGVHPNSVVQFAETLVGIPYVYGSTDPNVGFDCSGFITHVFNHFGIAVPRSSVDFTSVGKDVTIQNAKRGDLILFTGTNPAERIVGHMGIVVSNTDTLRFIHSTSGKAMGVTVTPLSEYYMTRFVRVTRIFPD